jgi:patatin-related protein
MSNTLVESRSSARVAAQRPGDQELRFAVVMTGGVSLAVWMGGVAYELQRLATRADPAYQDLCERLGTTPVVDVISGTSAGGLNGALLGFALARNCELGGLRDLWMDRASFDALLYAPTSKPNSLLKGDAYFLPAIEGGLRGLVGSTGKLQDDDHGRPLDLLITTTLLQGETRNMTDDYGTVIRDVDHHGLFHFTKKDLAGGDPQTVIRQLALAARSSASYPGAFEASFCPVDPGRNGRGRPDMGSVFNATMSHYVVDGGLLANKPIEPALNAIFEHPAQAPVRRVLAYVVPEPGETTYGEPDTEAKQPTLASVLADSVLKIPHAQSIATELERLRRHNRQVDAQRNLRRNLLLMADLSNLPADLVNDYWRRRAAQSVGDFMGELTRVLNSMRARDCLPRSWEVVLDFHSKDYGDVERTLLACQNELLPGGLPDGGDPSRWELARWGAEPLSRVAVTVLGMLRQAERVAEPAVAPRFREAAQDIHGCLQALRTDRRTLAAELRRGSAGVDALDPVPELDKWAKSTFAAMLEQERQRLGGKLPRYLEQLQHALVKLAGATESLRTASVDQGGQQRGEAGEFQLLLRGVLGSEAEPLPFAASLRNLLALDVLEVALAADDLVLEQKVELIQVSAETRNAFDADRRLPSQKLTGLQLHHFGAFYKRSWRANDWMWGRVDGAGWLVHILLSPGRLRECYRGVGEDCTQAALRDLEAVAVTQEPDKDRRRLLARLWELDREDISKELGLVFATPAGEAPDGSAGGPTSLPACSLAVARRLQLPILQDELQNVAQQARVDAQQGASERAAAPFLAAFEAAQRNSPSDGLSADDAVRLFRQCRVSEEVIADEVGSDLLTATMSTAAATGMAATRQPLKRLPKLLAPAAALVRGTGIAFWALSRAALQRSRTAFAMQLLMLALGLALLNVGKGRAVLGVGLDKLGLYAILASVLFAGLKVWGGVHRLIGSPGRRDRHVRQLSLWRLRQMTVVTLLLALAAVPALGFILAPKLPVFRDWPANGLQRFATWLQAHPGWWYLIATAVVCILLGTGWPAVLRKARRFGRDLRARLRRRLPGRAAEPEEQPLESMGPRKPERRLARLRRRWRSRRHQELIGDEPA